MITAIRRAVTSKVGAVIALLFLVLVGLSFALADVGNLGFGGGTSVGTGNIAKVGRQTITVNDIRQRFDQAYGAAAQQQPGLTREQFIARGGLDGVIKEATELAALEQYADALGIGIDDTSVHAAIASDPSFAGISGRFDQATFEQRLASMGRRPADYTREVANRMAVRQLIAPAGQVTAVPRGVTVPYASLLLEQRVGSAAFIPSARFMPTAAPTDAQVTAYYNSQRARYTIPERRVIRYAIIDESVVGDVPPVTAEEIAAEYRADAAQYAERESRRLSQVIAGSREAAQRIATAAASGTLEAAASAAGLQAASLTATSRDDFAAATSADAAQAVFAARQGAVVGPLQVPLGWIVIKVTSIDRTPARTLEQASGEIRTELATRKRREALDTLFNGAQDALNDGASLSDVAGDRGLSLVTTPALLPSGLSPADPAFRPDEQLGAILPATASLDAGDPAQIVPLEENRRFALVEIAEVIPAAPPALSSMRDRVVADWRLAEGAKAARDRARQMLAAVEGGQEMAAAASAAGVPGAVQTVNGRRIDMAQSGGRLPPEVALLFSMAPGTVKTLEMPANAGWMVIRLDRSIRADASDQPELLAGVEQQFGQAIGGEYVEVILAAARERFPIRIDSKAVDQLRAELDGTASAGN